MNIITRRCSLSLAASALASAAAGGGAQSVAAADVEPPKHPVEKDASLRVARPTKFVDPDEAIFRQNTEKFTKATGVPVRVDFVGFEDLRP
ncbi:MAG: carbohydrate ABC transporter substrate-binding protein, partial [Acetobacteraceae bacterium]|nr:carbohydrate ABC transporter substrate-binding protein [Acetobacteraceae bacterium]